MSLKIVLLAICDLKMSKNLKSKQEELIAIQLGELDELINSICYFYQFSNTDYYVTSDWQSKDVLAHIVSSYESFAQRLMALTVQQRPKALQGEIDEINNQEVKARKQLSVTQLNNNLKDAQKVVKILAGAPNIGLIPDKSGTNHHRIVDYLKIKYDHFQSHFKQVKESYAAS